jgi:hypothetical protein
MKLNMFRATHRPSSGAQNCTSGLWFSIRERMLDVEFAGRGQRPATSASNNLSRMQNQSLLVQFWAPDDGRCVARKSWASYKHGIINFDTLLHLVGYICMNHWCSSVWNRQRLLPTRDTRRIRYLARCVQFPNILNNFFSEFLGMKDGLKWTLPAELISLTSTSLKELLNVRYDFISFTNNTGIRGFVYKELALDIYV